MEKNSESVPTTRQQSSSAPKKKNNRYRSWFPWLVMVIFMIVSVYLYTQYKNIKQDPIEQTREEVKDLISEVSNLIVLPENETPTIATVSDPEKLAGQAFFANAKKGFKVLIYTEAKKAILYDPVAKKIIEVAPINIGENNRPNQASNTPAVTTTPQIDSSETEPEVSEENN